MNLSDQQVRALVSHVTSDWSGDASKKRLIEYAQDPFTSHLHPLFTIHLNGSEDYICNQALLISSSTQVEFFTFDLPIKTAMRMRYGTSITFYGEEIPEENKESSHYALLQIFHKGNTFFSLITVPSRFFD